MTQAMAVVGAGTMGNGIAHVFARAGYDVELRDVEQRYLDRALAAIEKNLDREIKRGKLPEAEKPAVLARLHLTTQLDALASAQLVVEAVPEQPAIKREILGELGRLLGDAIREQVGEEMLHRVERIRQTAVAFRRTETGAQEAKSELEALLNALDIEQTLHVVRAFSYFSHLLNIAEDTQQNRRRRAHAEAGSAPGACNTFRKSPRVTFVG